MQQWDVVVVGAGPAGSAAALAAKKADPGSRVLLLDRAVFPRDKVCGDGIAPETFDLLADLGVADVEHGHAPVPELCIVGPRGGQVRRRMARPARVIPRAVLDARLVDAAQRSGVEMDARTVRDVRARDGSVVIDDEIVAGVVVGADGAGSVVRRATESGRPPAGHTAVAIRGYATESPSVDEQLIVMDDADRWPAYAWSFPLADGTGRANVGYGVLVDPRRPAQRRELVSRLTSLLPWASSAPRWRGHLLPLSSWMPRQPDGRLLLAGDAAHLVNPLTGEGIWYAVLSGMLAGRAAVGADDPGSRYRTELRRHLSGHTRDVRLLSRVGRTARLVDAGVRAAAADQATFDDLVHLGLTDGRVTSRLLARTAVGAVSGARPRLK